MAGLAAPSAPEGWQRASPSALPKPELYLRLAWTEPSWLFPQFSLRFVNVLQELLQALANLRRPDQPCGFYGGLTIRISGLGKYGYNFSQFQVATVGEYFHDLYFPIGKARGQFAVVLADDHSNVGYVTKPKPRWNLHGRWDKNWLERR